MNFINQLNRITETYYNEIYTYCRRHVDKEDSAYDITQNVFLALSEQFGTINHDSVRKWLYETAKHKIADYFRDLYRQRENITDVPISEMSDVLTYNPYNETSEEEILQILDDLLKSLPDSEKTLFIDRFIYKTEYKALSEKYGVSETTMRKRVSRLYNKLLKSIYILLHVIIPTIAYLFILFS